MPGSQQAGLSASGMGALSRAPRGVGRYLPFVTGLHKHSVSQTLSFIPLYFLLFVIWLIRYCVIRETKMLKTLSKKAICSVVLSFKCGHFCAFLRSSSKKIGPDLLHKDR